MTKLYVSGYIHDRKQCMDTVVFPFGINHLYMYRITETNIIVSAVCLSCFCFTRIFVALRRNWHLLTIRRIIINLLENSILTYRYVRQNNIYEKFQLLKMYCLSFWQWQSGLQVVSRRRIGKDIIGKRIWPVILEIVTAWQTTLLTIMINDDPF